MFFDAKEARLEHHADGAQGRTRPMAGVPVRAAHHYIARLVRAGKRSPSASSHRSQQSSVSSDIVRIVTAGTLTEDESHGARPTSWPPAA
jgi:DNA mismatch repair protein MutS